MAAQTYKKLREYLSMSHLPRCESFMCAAASQVGWPLVYKVSMPFRFARAATFCAGVTKHACDIYHETRVLIGVLRARKFMAVQFVCGFLCTSFQHICGWAATVVWRGSLATQRLAGFLPSMRRVSGVQCEFAKTAHWASAASPQTASPVTIIAQRKPVHKDRVFACVCLLA